MALMEVQELSGSALDWAVAKCEGYIEDYYSWLHEATVKDVADSDGYHPSVKWGQGGPIIEQQGISVRPIRSPGHTLHGEYLAAIDHGNTGTMTRWNKNPKHPGYYSQGSTMLIAAMRCYVASKVGTHIEVPE